MMKQLKNKKGISLIEVLVASGVMGIFALTMMSQFDTQRKMVSTMEAGFDTVEALGQMRTIISDTRSCKKTFETITVVPEGTAVPEIKHVYKDTSGAWQVNVAFQANIPINPNIKFTSFTIKGANPSDGKATLSVEIERLKPGIMGGAKVIRNLQLFVVVDSSNKIVKCHGSVGSDDLADLCNSIEGGVWDAINRKCSIGTSGGDEHVESSQYSIASYLSPAPGKINNNWSLVRKLVVTNPRKTVRNYLVIAQTTVGSDGGPDWVNLMLKWNSGDVPVPFYNHDNVVAFDQKGADFNYDPTNGTTAMQRPALLQIVSIEKFASEETRTYSSWIRNSSGGENHHWGTKLSAIPID